MRSTMPDLPIDRPTETASTHVQTARWSAAVVILILVLAAFFDAISGNPIHSILLFGAAAALVSERLRSPARGVAKPALTVPAPPGWILVMTGLLYAVLIGEFGRYSWPATVAVLAPGAAALFLATMAANVLWVFSSTLLQLSVPDAYRGRVFSTDFALFTVVMSVSTFATGWSLDHSAATPRTLAAILGGLLCLPGLFWLPTALRRQLVLSVSSASSAAQGETHE